MVDISVIITKLGRSDLSLYKILQCIRSVTQCHRSGSLEADIELRTHGQVSCTLIVPQQSVIGCGLLRGRRNCPGTQVLCTSWQNSSGSSRAVPWRCMEGWGPWNQKYIKGCTETRPDLERCNQEGEPAVSTALSKYLLITYYVRVTVQSSEDSANGEGDKLGNTWITFSNMEIHIMKTIGQGNRQWLGVLG